MSSHVRLKKVPSLMPPLQTNPLSLTHVTSKVTGHYPRLAEGLSFLGLFAAEKKVSALIISKIPKAACIKSTSKTYLTG